jgi:hypothetical protein
VDKEKERRALSNQPSALSQDGLTAKDANTAKSGKELQGNFASSMIRALTTPQRRSLATFAPFAVQFLWLNADC